MPTGTYGSDRPDRAHGCNRRNRSYGHWRDWTYGSDRPDGAHGSRHWSDGSDRADWTYGADWSDGAHRCDGH